MSDQSTPVVSSEQPGKAIPLSKGKAANQPTSARGLFKPGTSRTPRNNELLFLGLIRTGLFEIDSEGRIWRLRVHSGACAQKCRRRAETTGDNGYLRAWFRHERQSRVALAHRIVWASLHGQIPEGMQVNHRNGVKADNRPDNLEIMDAVQQMEHAYRVLGKRTPRGEDHGGCKLTAAAVVRVKEMLSEGYTQQAIADRVGVCRATISSIKRGIIWKHLFTGEHP